MIRSIRFCRLARTVDVSKRQDSPSVNNCKIRCLITLQTRPTISTIDLDNLAFNLRSVREFIGADVKCLAVVKADAYGHGAVECSRRLEREGVDWLGVALPEEGVELRNAGIEKPILVLGSFWQGQENVIVESRLTPVVYTAEQAATVGRGSPKRRSE